MGEEQKNKTPPTEMMNLIPLSISKTQLTAHAEEEVPLEML